MPSALITDNLITGYFIKTLISVTPVIVFLCALIFMDSYKLVKFRSLLLTIVSGFLAALICLFINQTLMKAFRWEYVTYSRYVAPIIEELMKAVYVIYLMRSKRIGFMVDAGIQGFAVGAGFAIMENIYTLTAIAGANLFVWTIRGFGTAVMHGGAAALFAIISKSFSERHESYRAREFLPGLGLAVIFHSLYNHFLVSPFLSGFILVAGLPLLMILIYQQSEKALQKWLGVGFDTDAELLEIITRGTLTQTHVGQYLVSLKDRLPGEVVADMLCLLRIHLELSIRAKGILLMREAGFKVPPDPEIEKKFEELNYLQKSVGKTGYLAIMPFLRWSGHDLWQFHMLGKKR